MTEDEWDDDDGPACVWCGCSVYVAKSRFTARSQVTHGYGDIRCDRRPKQTRSRVATMPYVIEESP